MKSILKLNSQFKIDLKLNYLNLMKITLKKNLSKFRVDLKLIYLMERNNTPRMIFRIKQLSRQTSYQNLLQPKN